MTLNLDPKPYHFGSLLVAFGRGSGRFCLLGGEVAGGCGRLREVYNRGFKVKGTI